MVVLAYEPIWNITSTFLLGLVLVSSTWYYLKYGTIALVFVSVNYYIYYDIYYYCTTTFYSETKWFHLL